MSSDTIYYKYISFTLAEEKAKTKVFDCKNIKSGLLLGRVGWFNTWRQYCFSPVPNEHTIFNKECLDNISEFLNNLNQTHKRIKRFNNG